MPTPTGMAGPRSWLFSALGQTVGMSNTDFALDYACDAGQGAPVMKLSISKCWEHSDFSQYGMDRRKFMEDRLSVLATSTMINAIGTLTIDGVAVTHPVKFKGINVNDSGAPNELLIYTAEFERAFPGAQLARTIEFGDILTGSAQSFLVAFGNDDRSTFPEIFRSAPLLMRNGPGLQSLTITNVVQVVEGGNEFDCNANVEWACGQLIWIHKGKSKVLTIDGSEVGLCYLKDIVIADRLPNAVVLELQFVTGYGVVDPDDGE